MTREEALEIVIKEVANVLPPSTKKGWKIGGGSAATWAVDRPWSWNNSIGLSAYKAWHRATFGPDVFDTLIKRARTRVIELTEGIDTGPLPTPSGIAMTMRDAEAIVRPELVQALPSWTFEGRVIDGHEAVRWMYSHGPTPGRWRAQMAYEAQFGFWLSDILEMATLRAGELMRGVDTGPIKVDVERGGR